MAARRSHPEGWTVDVLVVLAARPAVGAGVGTALSSDDAPGAGAFRLFFGGIFGVPVGLMTSTLSAALVLTHAVTVNPRGLDGDLRVPLCWHPLVPLPTTALTTWRTMQSPTLALGLRVAVAAATAIAPTWVLRTARSVMGPLTTSSAADLRPTTRHPHPPRVGPARLTTWSCTCRGDAAS